MNIKKTIITASRVSIVTLSIFTFMGCADMSPTQQRTVSGAAIGAAGGALIGAMAGNAGMGAAIGGLAGASGGFLYGKHKEAEQSAYQRGLEDGRR